MRDHRFRSDQLRVPIFGSLVVTDRDDYYVIVCHDEHMFGVNLNDASPSSPPSAHRRLCRPSSPPSLRTPFPAQAVTTDVSTTPRRSAPAHDKLPDGLWVLVRWAGYEKTIWNVPRYMPLNTLQRYMKRKGRFGKLPSRTWPTDLSETSTPLGGWVRWCTGHMGDLVRTRGPKQHASLRTESMQRVIHESTRVKELRESMTGSVNTDFQARLDKRDVQTPPVSSPKGVSGSPSF